MPISILSGAPSESHLGDSVTWRESAPADADEIQEAFYLFADDQGNQRFKAVGAAEDSDNWLFSFDGAEVSDLKPGTFTGSRIVEYSWGRKTTASVYRLKLLPDPAATPAETHNERMVRLLEAHVEGRALDGVESHTVGGVPITQIPLDQAAALLRDYRGYLREERKAAAVKAGRQSGNRILIEF